MEIKVKKHEFTCSVCKNVVTHFSDIITGYATNEKDEKICYSCCAEIDKEYMKENGRIDLYLIEEKGRRNTLPSYKITNFPGTLEIKPSHVRTGSHNIAGKRTDVWFKFNGFIWHGVCYGSNTQVLRCKRTKRKSF